MWLAHGGWEGWKGQLQKALRRTSLTQTAPLQRTAPGGRRSAQIHTWTCSAVQKELGTSAGLSGMQQFSKARGLSLCLSPFSLNGPQWPLTLCQDSGQDTGTPQALCIGAQKVPSWVIFIGFHKETPHPAHPWEEYEVTKPQMATLAVPGFVNYFFVQFPVSL